MKCEWKQQSMLYRTSRLEQNRPESCNLLELKIICTIIFHCPLKKISFLLSFGVWILGVQSQNLILTLSGYLLRQAPIVLERSLHTSGIVADYSLKVMCLSWSVCCHASVNTRVQRVSSCIFVHMLIGVGGSHTCEGNDKSAWQAKIVFLEVSSYSVYLSNNALHACAYSMKLLEGDFLANTNKLEYFREVFSGHSQHNCFMSLIVLNR